ncbi:hypothetical protein B0H14DRAFT_3437012 [Mycena olivaceomarginata]|nr:hypothetical protein B0H14DRAFT_3437012 [Mycena olivaceomarginata]
MPQHQAHRMVHMGACPVHSYREQPNGAACVSEGVVVGWANAARRDATAQPHLTLTALNALAQGLALVNDGTGAHSGVKGYRIGQVRVVLSLSEREAWWDQFIEPSQVGI